jgi:molybdate/tungstate transport system substrate-binding protein
MKKARLFLVLLTLVAFTASIESGCAPKEKTPLVVFAAGSLIQPFTELEKAFEAKYPDIDVLAEYHGSIQVIRHATELHEAIDIVATADHALIPQLMYKVNIPDTNLPYATWYIRFATNKLGIAYTSKSKYADEINAENWAEVLARPDVKVGLADPRFDAVGYRALMVTKLAEQVYGKTGLFDALFSGQFTYPIKVDEGGTMSIIRVPEVLETTDSAHLVLRGGSIEVLALLDSGDVDYAFEYESVIAQHGLKLLALPDKLNLGAADQNDFYKNATVKLDFQRFTSVKPVFTGEQIGYGITIPSNAPHAKEAELFVAFLLGDEGRQIMAANHHPLFDTPAASGYNNLPEALKPFVKPMP